MNTEAFIKAYKESRNGASFFGGTELTAAMRCVVVSHSGEVVDVPNELI